ncbi:MAG: hypothetical protein GDA43_07530 [Hormoscilla sp. SP5CHS1]|nr:hypothetical protein [Hormoscilla sp. SP12CHS1]MBC6453075.1 hypothetical protein [Hormoscilla sp. SP5CHS1]
MASSALRRHRTPRRQRRRAGDRFLVYRADLASPTVIADYHWFNDWSRDTLIALPGLTRYAREAQQVKASLQKFGNLLVALPNSNFHGLFYGRWKLLTILSLSILELDKSYFWIRQKFPHLCSWGHGDRQLPLRDWTARARQGKILLGPIKQPHPSGNRQKKSCSIL